MSVITTNISEPLKVLSVFQEQIEMFVELITAVRNDLMGLTEGPLKIKKMAKRFGIDDPGLLSDAIDAIAYLILHTAKLNATEEDFNQLFEQC